MSAPRFQFYGNTVSPPARPAYWFLKAHGVDFEHNNVNTLAGEQHNPEFLKLNPNHKIPVLVDNKDGKKFVLTESTAILEYLCEELKLNGDWGMPTDTRERARVYEYINYHTSTTFPTMFKLLSLFFAYMKTKEDQSANIAEVSKEVAAWVPQFEARLNANGGYLANGKPSICDLLAFPIMTFVGKTEIGLNLFDWSAYPAVVAWMDKVAAAPGFEATHESVKGVVGSIRLP
jgi:glutathione S-transferase|eukprot:TRINITY_DN12368_c0_g2_i1.p1 TRINITY_DN12368_c0_g2~~TRINITY_DN12368_c0_g2_i1.p1  ORF type:complete len:232 (-),score=20.97 TRINITY_DN12368_c0_g2_i1:154-849(-)